MLSSRRCVKSCYYVPISDGLFSLSEFSQGTWSPRRFSLPLPSLGGAPGLRTYRAGSVAPDGDEPARDRLRDAARETRRAACTGGPGAGARTEGPSSIPPPLFLLPPHSHTKGSRRKVFRVILVHSDQKLCSVLCFRLSIYSIFLFFNKCELTTCCVPGIVLNTGTGW